MKLVDLSGQVINNRLILELLKERLEYGKTKHKELQYRTKCLDCGKLKDLSRTSLKYGRCQCARFRHKKPPNLDQQDKHLRRTYGMSIQDMLAMKDRQESKCKLCRKSFSRTPSVDHDHACCPGPKSCGKCVRGLLCQSCNTGLGNFQESPQLLTDAASYIQSFRSSTNLLVNRTETV